MRRFIPLLASLTATMAPILANASVQGAMAAGGNWLISVIVIAAIIIIIIACVAIATGRGSLAGVLFVIGGIAAATHPQEIASIITSN